MASDKTGTIKRQEFGAFLLLSVFLAPVLSVILVGGYGFIIWMFQLIAGPPGMS